MMNLTKNQIFSIEEYQKQAELQGIDFMNILEHMRNQVLISSMITDCNIGFKNYTNEINMLCNFVDWENLNQIYWINTDECSQMNLHKYTYSNHHYYNSLPTFQENDYLPSSIKQRKDSQGDNSECEKLWSYTNWHISETQTNECKGSDWGEQDAWESDHKTFWSWGLSKDQALVLDKILTPNNIEYLEALKEFNYEIEEKRKKLKIKYQLCFYL